MFNFNPFFKFAQALVNKVKCLRTNFYLHDAPAKTNLINSLYFALLLLIFLFLFAIACVTTATGVREFLVTDQ